MTGGECPGRMSGGGICPGECPAPGPPHIVSKNSFVFTSLLTNVVKNVSLNVLLKVRDGVQNVFVKSFHSRSGRSALLKICARLRR